VNKGAVPLAGRHEAREARSLFANPILAALLIIAVALATRCLSFGNPVIEMDDQFYWLVGREWWQGQWPILDVWDRKPVGLFVIYGAIAGIDRSFLAVQLVATAFAAATAWTIRAAAKLFAGAQGATLAGIAYLLAIAAIGGQSGQSPVFYNLFTALGGYWLLRTAGSSDVARARRAALGTMLAIGAAMVVKQVSMAEGIFFGLAYLSLLRRSGQDWPKIVAFAVLMAAVALLPSVAGLVLYAAHGREAFDAYVYAAYASIFSKRLTAPGAQGDGLKVIAFYLLPLIVLAVMGIARRQREAVMPLRRYLLIGWLLAAVAGFAMIPNFFPHYALPLAVPLALCAASVLDGLIGWLALTAIVAMLVPQQELGRRHGQESRRMFEQVLAGVEASRHSGCLYVANGPTALYAMSSACRVTKYLFPYHLSLANEGTAIGTDQSAEIARILSHRPAVVVSQSNRMSQFRKDARQLLEHTLADQYRLVLTLPETGGEALQTIQVWQRNDLPPPAKD
jgi:hypothetical protein